MNIFRPIFTILFIATLSVGVIYLFQKGNLDKANRPIKVITPENYTQSVKEQIKFDDTVQITGTPDLIRQVSEETIDDESKNRRIEYYYVALKEYGTDFVVRIKPGELTAQQQTFIGITTGINRTDYGTRIKNSLNKEINFEDSVNIEAAKEIDVESQNQLKERSTANFSNDALLILDEVRFEKDKTYFNFAFWTTLLTVFVVTLFRKNIFNIK